LMTHRSKPVDSHVEPPLPAPILPMELPRRDEVEDPRSSPHARA